MLTRRRRENKETTAGRVLTLHGYAATADWFPLNEQSKDLRSV